MGVTSSNKQIDATQIDCNGTLKVTLALSAAPDISSNPTDIVLVLDRSGSMGGTPLANMKAGAKAFVDIIEEATDNTPDGNIGSGSRMGVVSFSNTATTDTQLITSVADLKTAIDNLTASGSTNHADAFTKATQLFDPMSGNAKVMVMFTDGKTTAGFPPEPVAAAARAQGIIIYCIGLVGSDGMDVNVLNDWATDPDSSHVAITPNETDLEDLFRDLAANISKTGATNIVIDEILNPDFTIINLLPPTKGMASLIDSHTIQWKIDALGGSTNEGASLEFYVHHTAQTSGEKPVNQSVMYSDAEGNMVTFPNPSVTVDCNGTVIIEPCPVPVNITISGCDDAVVFDMGDANLESLGRILQLNVTLKHICPGRRVAMAVSLSEIDEQGTEYPRGTKALTIPAHTGQTCQDVLVKCLKFVLPEDLNVSGSTPNTICSPRSFKARVIANYVDTDFQCCDAVITIP